MKRALVVGSEGQDGRLLSQRLVREGAAVLGLSRRGLTEPGRPLKRLDILKAAAVDALIRAKRTDEIYYLAAYHHSAQDKLPPSDLELFRRSHDVHVQGLLHFLEAVARRSPKTRLFYAASSHVFGSPAQSPQDEATPLAPSCAYGITKTMGIQCCRFYRARGIFASTGILYNHESPLRARAFVIPKIIHGALAIKSGRAKTLRLGSLAARVDWGYAPDTVDAMARILALPEPGDFVVATGKAHTVKDVVTAVFGELGLSWRDYVREDPGVLTKKKAALVGNAAKLKRLTGWKPTVSFEEMVKLLVRAAA